MNQKIIPEKDINQINQSFYDNLWASAEFCEPERFNTWPLLSDLIEQADMRLEIGPGLRPRLPVRGTHFIDLSPVAVEKLNARGAHAQVSCGTHLNYPNKHFDLVCAFDVIEHIEDDQTVFTEIHRVLKDNALLFFSVPLHPDAWSNFDSVVGHCRRYDPHVLKAQLEDCGFELVSSAGFGMKPKSRFFTRLGMFWLEKFPEQAFHYYNKYFFPLGLKRQEKLQMQSGLTDSSGFEGEIFCCRKTGAFPTLS